MTRFQKLEKQLQRAPRTWLVTGVAGFIGSNVLEALLRLNQRVIGLDNFSTGHRSNLDQVEEALERRQWKRFRLRQGDISDPQACRKACANAELVIHLAALGSVPASLDDPSNCHRSNVTGFLNLLLAARDAGVRRLVYASSSAVYGDNPDLPKKEEKIGRPLSPYAASKSMNEIYAQAFAKSFGFNSIGLRYFNVFGPRQDPEGAYAAVIPKWISALIQREPVYINGDGKTTRDFCYISNVVQANLLAATTTKPAALNEVFNIALGERTTLNGLFRMLQAELRRLDPSLPKQVPVYRAFRDGDIRHSVASITKAGKLLGYEPTHRIDAGLKLAMDWYRRNLG